MDEKRIRDIIKIHEKAIKRWKKKLKKVNTKSTKTGS